MLLLVLAAFGLLVAALVTSTTGWAWGSVGASGVAAGLLIADWFGRRRAEPAPAEPLPARSRPAKSPPAKSPPAESPASESQPDADGAPAEQRATATEPPADDDAPVFDPEVEPAEENTDVADAIAVTDLTDEVVVIDERPRYHLAGCRWVGDRETIPLPVTEARELGFTPCAVCAPDSFLAAVHRANR